jgi:hypothetical protein
MKYILNSETEAIRARLYLEKLIKKKAFVELREITKRSLNQNAYLHLIIGWFGNEYGYTIEEAKMIYKMVSQSIYFYEKDGFEFVRSSADITKEEMNTSIEAFRKYSSEMGLYLPEPNETEYLKAIEMELSNQRYDQWT